MLYNHFCSSNSHFSLYEIPNPSDNDNMRPCLSDAKSYRFVGSSFELSYIITPTARRDPSMRPKGHGTEQIYTCVPSVAHCRFIFFHKMHSKHLAQGRTSHPHSLTKLEQREEKLQHCEVGRSWRSEQRRGWRTRGRCRWTPFKARMSQLASLHPLFTLAAPEFCVSSELPAKD